MKDHDWRYKMKPTEYSRLCEWCRDNEFRESDITSLSLYGEKHSIHLFNYHKCIDGVMVHIESYCSKFVDSHTAFLYVEVRLEFVQPTIVGISDYIRVCKLISSVDELEALITNIQNVKDLAYKTKVTNE